MKNRYHAALAALPFVLAATLAAPVFANDTTGSKTKATTTGSANNANSSASTGNVPSPGATGTATAMTDADFDTVYGAMDANRDGVISRSEYMNYYGSRYDRYDTARKGSLDRQSVRSAMFDREMRKTDGNAQGNRQSSSSSMPVGK